MPWIKGRKHSEETREKIKEILKEKYLNGQPLNSGNFKKGLVPWNTGKSPTEETRKKDKRIY